MMNIMLIATGKQMERFIVYRAKECIFILFESYKQIGKVKNVM